MSHIIKHIDFKDLGPLIEFFREAYGQNSIFQNELFLKWYFSPEGYNIKNFMKKNIICLTNDGKIVSHYGGICYNMKIGTDIIPCTWGVSAYTLKNWRGQGINSKIVDINIQSNDINGVIGFTDKTGDFYRTLSYNIFNFKRFHRFIFIINSIKTEEVIGLINQDLEKFHNLVLKPHSPNEYLNECAIIKLSPNSLKTLDINFNASVFATTLRDKSLLNWRFLQNPFIKYDLFAILNNNTITSYVACRREILHPTTYTVNRIIDLFGNEKECEHLLNHIIKNSIENDDIYIDFSMIGTLYEECFCKAGFTKLEGELCSILPQVTHPIENRMNFEYFGLSSKKYGHLINELTVKDIYFTRMDSDRDRLNNINQIQTNKL